MVSSSHKQIWKGIMTQLSPLGRFAISPVSAYCPGVSTVVSLVKLFQKYVMLPRIGYICNRGMTSEQWISRSDNPSLSDRYCILLEKESLGRLLLMLVPILGNIVIALVDFWNSTRKQSLLASLQSDPLAFNAVSEHLQQDPEVQAAAIKSAVTAITAKKTDAEAQTLYSQLNERLQRNTEVATAAAQKGAKVELCMLDHGACNDKPLVLLVVAKHKDQLKWASTDLQKDEDVVLAAVKLSQYDISYADETLQKSPEFMLKALAANKDVRLDNSLTDNAEFMLEALQVADKYHHISDRLKKTPEFMLQAMKNEKARSSNNWAYSYTDDSLKEDPKFMLQALEITEHYYGISDRLKKDRDFMLKAIKIAATKHPDSTNWAFMYTSDSLKKDLHFMLSAIELTKTVFNQADESIQKNPQFVHKALDTHADFQADLSFMLKAIQVDPTTASKAHKSVSENLQFKEALAKLTKASA